MFAKLQALIVVAALGTTAVLLAIYFCSWLKSRNRH